MTTTTKLPTIAFETTDCDRCGGSGMYGPMCIDSGRCFGCGGKGIRLSRAGKIARDRYDAIMGKMHVRIDEIKAGDRIKIELAHTRAWQMRKREAWYTVLEITSKFEGCKIGDEDVMSHTLTLDLGNINTDDWCVPVYSGNDFALPVWDRDIYLEAINACRRLKGATITDPEPVVDEIMTMLDNAPTVADKILGTGDVAAPAGRTNGRTATGSHAACDHETTPAARRRCRAARNA